MNTQVYCINRNVDVDRHARFNGICCALGVTYVRVEAVDSLSDKFQLAPYLRFLPKVGRFQKQVPLGSFGNWMSQMSAWRMISATGAPGLICEDDAVLNSTVHTLDDLAQIDTGWDVVFCNNRCAPPSFISGNIERRCTSLAVSRLPLSFVMQLHMLSPQPFTTPGADCYLVSPRGARKLLSIVDELGVFDFLDWMMVRYSLTRMNAADFTVGNVRQPFNNMIATLPLTATSLESFVRVTPVADTMPREVGGSVTKSDENRTKFIDVARRCVVRG